MRTYLTLEADTFPNSVSGLQGSTLRVHGRTKDVVMH
jgi:hypothetical protein